MQKNTSDTATRGDSLTGRNIPHPAERWRFDSDLAAPKCRALGSKIEDAYKYEHNTF